MARGYPESLMEYVVGVPIPKAKLKPKREPPPAPKLRKKSPRRRVVVRVETSDSEYDSTSSSSENSLIVKKKVRFEEPLKSALQRDGGNEKPPKEAPKHASESQKEESHCKCCSGQKEGDD